MERDSVSRRRVLGALGAAMTGSVAGCTLAPPSEDDETDANDPGLGRHPGSRANVADLDDSATYADVYDAVVDSVAGVRLQTSGGAARGSAWVYDDQYVVTNEHVVADRTGEPALWFTDVGWREASVVGADVYSDLAVLKAPNLPDSATPLPFVESSPPVGTPVAAIGNPFGLTGSLTTGVISGRGRTLPAPNGFSIPHTVQMDAAVNPGNSGGPLVTRQGRVAGVVNAGGGDNIGFAISAAIAQRVVPGLIDDGDYDHSYLGIGLNDVSPALVTANDLPVARGIYVARVVGDGPSVGVLQGTEKETTVDGERVQVGGDVIVELAGEPIPNSDALSSVLAIETRPGDTVDVDIYRDGERQTVQLTLGNRPDA